MAIAGRDAVCFALVIIKCWRPGELSVIFIVYHP